MVKVNKEQIKEFIEKYGIVEGNIIKFYFSDNKQPIEKKDFNYTSQDVSTHKNIKKFCSILEPIISSFDSVNEAYLKYGDYTIADHFDENRNEVYIKACGFCNSFIDSSKIFLDYLQNEWCNRNIKTNYEEWNNTRTSYFTNNLGYQVCYYLRNLREHSGNGQVFIEFYPEQIDNSVVFDLKIDKEKILSDRRSARQFLDKVNVDSDYFTKEDNLLVNQYLKTYMACIKELYKLAIDKYFSENYLEIQKVINDCLKSKLLSRNIFFIKANYKNFMNDGDLGYKISELTTVVQLQRLLVKLKQIGFKQIKF